MGAPVSRFPTDGMVQIPYPVEPSKVQEVSHRAMARWKGGDAEHVGVGHLHPGVHHARHHGSRSRKSSFDGTVRLSDTDSMGGLNHGVRCDSCSQVWPSLLSAPACWVMKLIAIMLKMIVGVRYQCGNCPSIPLPFNLVRGLVSKPRSALPEPYDVVSIVRQQIIHGPRSYAHILQASSTG